MFIPEAKTTTDELSIFAKTQKHVMLSLFKANLIGKMNKVFLNIKILKYILK